MLAPTPVRYSGVVPQPFRPDSVAPLRRSVAMLRPRDPAGLDRETALELLEEIERLQRSERQLTRLRHQLHTLVEELDHNPS